MRIVSKRIAVSYLSLAILAVTGCGGAPEDSAPVWRLTQERFSHAAEFSEPPSPIGADTKWHVSDAEILEYTTAGLRIDATAGAAGMSLPVEIDASHYSEFRVRIRVALEEPAGRSGGNTAIPLATFSWRSPIDPAHSA